MNSTHFVVFIMIRQILTNIYIGKLGLNSEEDNYGNYTYKGENNRH